MAAPTLGERGISPAPKARRTFSRRGFFGLGAVAIVSPIAVACADTAVHVKGKIGGQDVDFDATAKDIVDLAAGASKGITGTVGGPGTGVASSADVEKAVAQAVQTQVPRAVATEMARRGFSDLPVIETSAYTEKGGIKFANVPSTVNAANIDFTRGGFKNTVGIGTFVIGEPGVLHMGADGLVQPENAAGYKAFKESEGAIQLFNPLNQEGVRWYGGGEQRLPEGGFVYMTAGNLRFRVGNHAGAPAFDLPHKEGHNYMVYVRGRYGDNKQDTDKNLNIVVEPGSYRVGNVQLREYSPLRKTNAGFVSEGQFLQETITSHSGGGNAGDGGASKLTAIFFDYNTGALEVATHTMDRFGDPRVGWKVEYRNFTP